MVNFQKICQTSFQQIIKYIVVVHDMQMTVTIHVNQLRLYTCQLFLRYKREIFILGVLGILTTTRSFPKSSEEVRRLPKSSKVLVRSQCF